MKKILDFIKNYFLVIYLISNILYINVCTTLIGFKVFSYSFFGRSYIVLLIVSLIVSLFLLIYKRVNHKYKFEIYDLLILLLCIVSCISTIYAIKPKTALIGLNARYEGLIALLYYYNLLYIASFIEKDTKKIIVALIIISTVYQTIYALMQFFDAPFVYKYIKTTRIWPMGTMTNPNFYSSLILMGVLSTIGLLVDSNKKYMKVILYLIILFLFLGLIIGNTLSCIVGLIVCAIYLLIYLIKRKKVKVFILLFITFVVILFGAYKTNMTLLISDSKKTTNEVVEMSKGNTQNSFGNNRIEIWSKSFNIVPYYLLHGAGVDNFFYAFGPNRLRIEDKTIDKAHNEYLQILITEGLFALIVYISLYLIVLLRGIKNNKIYLILPVLGYMVQAFFNISVIEVAPIFFILLGMLIERKVM